MSIENNPAQPHDQRHIEGDDFASSPRGENPVGDSFNVIVSVPESIQIKMVDASSLADYEVWVFIASILSNAVVGFLVAYFQAVDGKSPSVSYIGWTLVVFISIFFVALITAIWKRNQLKKKGRDIKLRTSGVSQ